MKAENSERNKIRKNTELRSLKDLDVSVLILAGGKSLRFGSSKLEAMLGGQRVIDYVAQMAASLSERILVSCGEKTKPLALPYPLLVDSVPGAGPLSGISSGLLAAKTEYLAVMPGDMPMLGKEVYLRLGARITPAKIVFANSSRGPEPLVSIWPTVLALQTSAALSAGRLSVRDLLQATDAISVDFASNPGDAFANDFLNVNYLSDLERIRKQLQS